ncbi:MAG TPA: hypothetical protein VGH94_11765 [Acidimicrobiales bacterium]|jgi:hypothetical protein
MSIRPELSSMSTALAELGSRIGRLGDELAGTDRDDLSNALYEVERSLTAAQRRLTKVIDNLERG